MNVSAIVVQTRPEYIEEVTKTLQESDLCDFHFGDDLGRLIVTIEAEGTEGEIKALSQIQKFPHVVTADMQFAYSEDELNEERSKLEVEGGDIPSWLNDDEANLKNIQYNGDIRKKQFD